MDPFKGFQEKEGEPLSLYLARRPLLFYLALFGSLSCSKSPLSGFIWLFILLEEPFIWLFESLFLNVNFSLLSLFSPFLSCLSYPPDLAILSLPLLWSVAHFQFLSGPALSSL